MPRNSKPKMRIWAWGANTNGQLGLGHSSEQESVPTEVKFQAPSRPPLPSQHQHQLQEILPLVGNIGLPLMIAGGASQTLALLRFPDSARFNQYEVETLESIQVSPTFQLLQYPQATKIAAGWDFSLYVDTFGKLHSCGDNTYSQLGRKISAEEQKQNNSNRKQYTTQWGKHDTLYDSTVRFISVSAGMRHAAGISCIDGDVYVWGDNSKNQLGISVISETGEVSVNPVEFPTRVEIALGIYSFYKVACGKDFTIVVHDSGHLFGCGQNKNGVLLHAPQDIKEFKTFTHIYERLSEDEEEDIKDIQCGWSFVLVLLENGRVMSWGRNDFGQLGRRSVNPKFDVEPGYLQFPEEIEAIACGSEHSLALGKSGKVYAWGWNEHDNCGVKNKNTPGNIEGEMCDGQSDSGATVKREDCILFPTEVPFQEEGIKVAVIGCGAGSSFAISI